jgi:hypothetical protein
VDAFLEKLRGVSVRRKPTKKYPNLLCADLVDGWDGPGRTLLDDWLFLIEAAYHPTGRPSGTANRGQHLDGVGRLI